MSHYLSQLEGSERAQERIRNDKEMNKSQTSIGCPECAWGRVAGCWRCGSNLHPVFVRALAPFMPPQFSEAELIAADLAYLEGQARRARELVDLLHEQELNRLREVGGL